MASFGSRAALLLSAVLPALAAPAPAPAALQHGSVVPGTYIVKVRPELPEAEFESQVQWVSDVHKRSLGRRDTKGLRKTFSFNGFKAYSGEFDDTTIELIKANDTVSFPLPFPLLSFPFRPYPRFPNIFFCSILFEVMRSVTLDDYLLMRMYIYRSSLWSPMLSSARSTSS